MRIKIDSVRLWLDDNGCKIFFTKDNRLVEWYVKNQMNRMPISKLLTPNAIDQLAYDLYKTLANVTGPVLVAEWPELQTGYKIGSRWDEPSQAYNEYSRVRMVLDTIVRSYR